MDRVASELAEYLVGRLQTIDGRKRLLVGIAGIPASGKSTLAQLVTDKTNTLLARSAALAATHDQSGPSAEYQGQTAILVGLDGWHLTRLQLDHLPDPKLAHDRRGAHWTFDGHSYLTFLRLLRQELTSATPVITAPSFDHALKDPTPDAVSIHPYHRIVIIEGLYTFLSIDPWVEAAGLLDERWFVSVELKEAKHRLVKRHVLTAVAKDLDEAIWRAENNDGPNGQFIIDNILEPTRIIQSVEDPVFATF